MAHIHILGASGSGTTTLGQALARRIGAQHLDTDDIFWLPSDPPFSKPRPVEERLAILSQQAPAAGHWVLSGSALKWAKPIEPLYDLVIFLRLDPRLRMERLRRREVERYGPRIAPGGDMAASSQEFLEWAESYDTAGPERRSLVGHEQWLATLSCPVVRLDSSLPLDSLVAEVMPHIGPSESRRVG